MADRFLFTNPRCEKGAGDEYVFKADLPQHVINDPALVAVAVKQFHGLVHVAVDSFMDEHAKQLDRSLVG